MRKMTKFYEKTGMYIDWDQLSNLPDIDTFVDIGVGPKGTPKFWNKYYDKKLVCIDPLPEAQEITAELLDGANYQFFLCALGSQAAHMYLNVEENKGRSSLLEATAINVESENIEKLKVEVRTLDDILGNDVAEGRIGIKIDTEGYELEILKGSTQTLSKTNFVIAEVRHNHTSFKQQYSFQEFNTFMFNVGFVPAIVFTAKPFILDICYQPLIAVT